MEAGSVSRIRLVTASAILLVVSQIFMASLSTSTFEKIYLNFLTSSYGVIGKDFRRSVEQAIRFGKPLEK